MSDWAGTFKRPSIKPLDSGILSHNGKDLGVRQNG